MGATTNGRDIWLSLTDEQRQQALLAAKEGGWFSGGVHEVKHERSEAYAEGEAYGRADERNRIRVALERRLAWMRRDPSIPERIIDDLAAAIRQACSGEG